MNNDVSDDGSTEFDVYKTQAQTSDRGPMYKRMGNFLLSSEVQYFLVYKKTDTFMCFLRLLKFPRQAYIRNRWGFLNFDLQMDLEDTIGSLKALVDDDQAEPMS